MKKLSYSTKSLVCFLLALVPLILNIWFKSPLLGIANGILLYAGWYFLGAGIGYDKGQHEEREKNSVTTSIYIW